MKVNTVYHNNKLTMIIDKYNLGRHKLVCTINNNNIACTFLVVGLLDNLIELMRFLVRNKKKLIKSTEVLETGLEWNDLKFETKGVSFLLKGNYINEKENINKFTSIILNLLNVKQKL